MIRLIVVRLMWAALVIWLFSQATEVFTEDPNLFLTSTVFDS